MHLVAGLIAPTIVIVDPATNLYFPYVQSPVKIVFPVAMTALSP